MKVLIITPECPFPPAKSGGIHTVFNLIKHSGKHKVDILYYGEKDREAEAGLTEYADKIIYHSLGKDSSRSRIKSIFKGCPYAIYRYSELVNFDAREYDRVILDQFSSLPLIKGLRLSSKPIAFLHDSMPLYYVRRAEASNSIVEKTYYYLQSRFAKKTERALLSLYEKSVYVSAVDAAETQSRIGSIVKCDTIELGVDKVSFAAALDLGESIVFSGIMDYGPNEDAALYFAKDVFPEISKKFPNVRLYLVGKNPTDKLLKLADTNDRIIVTGFVDSVQEYILGATVYVSPLRYGTGVKNKVLEALQCNKSSVFSPVSIDGIPEISEGKNCLVAKNDREWVDAVSFLLASAEDRKVLEDELQENPIAQTRSWELSFEKLIER